LLQQGNKAEKHFQIQRLISSQLVGDITLRTACVSDIDLYLTVMGQAKQFIETCGT
jgi:hypothetical protein